MERLKAILKSSSESKQIAGTFRDAVPQDFAFVGAPILRRIPEWLFRRLLAVLLIVLGLTLVLGIGQ